MLNFSPKSARPLLNQGFFFRFTDLAEMVCRVRQTTPDRQIVPYSAESDLSDNSETEPDDSDFLTDPENCIEEVTIFLIQINEVVWSLYLLTKINIKTELNIDGL